ncbi:MAG: hypothetical protein ACR2PQ_02710 [Myxococcota bacterium]
MTRFALLLALALALPAVPAEAITFEDGGTHLVDTDQTGKDGSVTVNDGPGNAATTVTVTSTLEQGAGVTGVSDLTLDGATTGSSAYALDDATLTVIHSDVGNDVYGTGRSSVTVHDVTVMTNIFALGYAEIDVSAATVGTPADAGGRNLYANDSAFIRAHTGTVVLDEVFTNGQGTVVLEDVEVGQRLYANGMSRIDILGGSIAEDIASNGESTIRIFGADFAVDGSPVPLGPIAALSGTLTGELSDGSPLDNPFARSETATILLTEVPEVAAPLMLAAGMLVLFAAGRRR